MAQLTCPKGHTTGIRALHDETRSFEIHRVFDDGYIEFGDDSDIVGDTWNYRLFCEAELENGHACDTEFPVPEGFRV